MVGVLAASASSVFAQKELAINVIQGSKNISAHDKEQVRVTGIVTARTRTGFFVQTPDDKVDSDPMTSEGIFIFTRDEPPAEAAVGDLVAVSGMVTEFRPRAEPDSLPITEVSHRKGQDALTVVAKGVGLPKQVVLTVADFKLNTLDQLERYEGMRVLVPELVTSAPTGGRFDLKNNRSASNGTFYGVIKGLGRPFREPGYDIYEFVFLSDKEKEEFRKAHPKVGFFDANPERLRIESSAQLGSDPINIPALTELKNVGGVLHYSYRTYTILLDAATRPSVSSYPKNNALPVATERQFSIAGINIENFFDDKDDADIKEDIVTPAAFESRMKKISLAIRNVLQTPDVVGIVESENLAALKRLAEKVNSDAVAAGKPNPKYEAHLIEGNDGRGIDCGFLVKTSRVSVIEVKQLGKSDKYKNPSTNQENNLNDRPPLMLRASLIDSKTNQPFEFTVVVNHMKSFLGYNDPRQMANVRLKKKMQAEFLARFVQERQKANPAEKIILVGDFNAFQFNDGIVDVIGTIKGKPAAKDELLHATEDLVDPDMINLVDLIAADQRYSYRFDGNAQVLDHIIVSNSLRGHIHGFGYARVNADFPETMRSDDTRPERFSDHDAAVAYFTLDERITSSAPATVKTPN